MAADLAIIGGGPAGLFAALAAARHAPRWRVAWVRGAAHDFGPAYASRSDAHLLNVRAGNMGAFVDKPDDFAHWLAGGGDAARVGKSFAPRWRYGAYLHHLASHLPVNVELIDKPARLVGRGLFDWRVVLAPRGGLRAKRVIVAPGLAPPADLGPLPPGVIADVWTWWNALPPDWRPPGPDATVRIIGGGLTAVDMVVGLRARGFTGRIEAISRAGAWPQAHADGPAPRAAEAELLAKDLSTMSSAPAILARLRREIVDGETWRSVMDGLRPHSNAIWAAWDWPLKAQLLRHGFGAWNRYRHRMAPEIAGRLAADAKLTLRRGRAETDLDGVRIDGAPPPPAALTLICTNMLGRDIVSATPILRRMARRGLLQRDPLGIGVLPPQRRDLAVLGAPLFPYLFETTAVPELRAQADAAIKAWV